VHQVVILVAVVLFCTSAVFFDLRTGRIPNLLNAAGLVAGLGLAAASGGTAGLASSAAGALLGLSVLLIPFLLHMVGGGDVKFMTAAGAIVGWGALWISFLLGAAVGGAVGLVKVLRRHRSVDALMARGMLLRSGGLDADRGRDGVRVHSGDARMAYALPLSIGLLLVSTLRLFP